MLTDRSRTAGGDARSPWTSIHLKQHRRRPKMALTTSEPGTTGPEPVPVPGAASTTLGDPEAVRADIVARLSSLHPLDGDERAMRAVRHSREANRTKRAVSTGDARAFLVSLGIAHVIAQLRVVNDPVDA